MKTLDLSTPPGKLTRLDMQAAVEAKLQKIQTAATGLLREIGNVDPFVAEALRDKSSRLSGLAFTLTRCLCYGEIERAHSIVTGESDEYGEVLGVGV